MRRIEVSDDVYERLSRLTADIGHGPNEVLASLLNLGSNPGALAESLVGYVLGTEFRGKTADDDKYLCILSWISTRHGSEFREFIRSLSSGFNGRSYLGLSQAEIVEQCRHNQARQIPNTQFWAIMNIDSATKQRFLSHVLEFVGYEDDLIGYVCSFLGGRHSSRLSLRAIF